MNKPEPQAGGGLLSRVVRLMRSPRAGDAAAGEGDSESRYSKQMLKEMIERKRRNDFVRRREFDQLRRLRRREISPGQVIEGVDPMGHSSFFQSSLASADDRADTLRKIDEIEAQMSQQWWKSKKGERAAPVAAPAAHGTPQQDAARQPPQPPAQAAAPQPERSADAASSLQPSSLPPPGQAPQPLEQPLAAARVQSLQGAPAGSPTAPERGAPLDMALDLGFGADTQPVAAPPSAAPRARFVHDTDLEEAAILFANADYDGAEAALLDLLAQRKQADPQAQYGVWMALFDLLRATGRQERFEALAIDFAKRFGRTSPLWFSLPEQLGLPSASAQDGAAAQRELNWSAPAQLGQQSVAALLAALERAAQPWAMNWARLTSIEPPAVAALAGVFERWAGQPVELHFSGVQALHDLLTAHTPSGERASDPAWWRLRMSTLRLTGQMDEFELVALDYCVTYEVSPPSWEAPRCLYGDDDPARRAAPVPDSETLLSDFGLSSILSTQMPAYQAQLSGHIEGDATPLLEPMQEWMQPGQVFTIACDRLIRIDFAAIGSVLNWAAAREAEGHRVEFTELHRLVAVFFNIIGVDQHAAIVARER